MQLTLIRKQFRSGNIWSFWFAPDHPVSWQAGQFMRVSLPHANPDAKGALRWFTVAAAPHEQNLGITTRLTNSSFKQALGRLEVGGKLELAEAPAGDFLWRPSDRPHIFAAQGVVITPFYAIIKDRRHRGLPVQADLLYGYQPDTEPVFADELTAWSQADPTFSVTFLEGLVQAEDIVRRMPDYAERFVYASGPKALLGLCLAPHRLPLSQLKQDNFPGYASSEY